MSDISRQSPYPHVEFTGDVFDSLTSFTVTADGVDILSCSDVTSAVTACFAMYWIFDIKYPKMFYGFLSFLDNFVFKKNSVRASQKVSNFVNKL